MRSDQLPIDEHIDRVKLLLHTTSRIVRLTTEEVELLTERLREQDRPAAQRLPTNGNGWAA